MDNSLDRKKETINDFTNKDNYYSNLVEYNKKIHNKNQNKEIKMNEEIKIYQKPSILQGKQTSDKNKLLEEISRQKNTNSQDINLNEIEIKPYKSPINKEKENIQNKQQKTFQEKKMEENLESKYGKGYKILKMAGYQLGKGLGKEEQGITDPILVKKRKERAGINNEEENDEDMIDMGKANNFILGKKRLNEEKNYEETNEEFKNFDLILEEYNKDKNGEKIWNLLDEDRRIKKKYHGKGGRSFGFSKFRKKFKDDFPELKGKEIFFKNMEKMEKEELKEKIAKMIWVTKDKIVDKLRQYYENENNKFIYEKVHMNTDTEQNKIFENLEDENELLQKIKGNKIYKEPEKHGDLSYIINFIDEYLKLYESNQNLYKKILPKFSLYCLKITIIYLDEMNLDIRLLLDKDKGKLLSLICSKIKDLLNYTYNSKENFIEEENNDNYLLHPQKNSNILNELEKDNFDKANDYYNMFISQIIFNKLSFYIDNKWDVQNSKPIINISHLYSEILPKNFIEILNKKISGSIINQLNKNYHFIYSKNEKDIENLKIHKWIHPLLDILSLDALTDILRLIEQKIKDSIKKWNLYDLEESQFLINLLSPWSKLFGENFWKDLYKKYFSPVLNKMFSELYIKIEEKMENIHCIKLMFSLNEKKIIPSKKCAKILKKYFLVKLKHFIKNWMNKYRYDIEKNKILNKWCSDSINIIKSKNNIYEEIKEDLNECLLLLNI